MSDQPRRRFPLCVTVLTAPRAREHTAERWVQGMRVSLKESPRLAERAILFAIIPDDLHASQGPVFRRRFEVVNRDARRNDRRLSARALLSNNFRNFHIFHLPFGDHLPSFASAGL